MSFADTATRAATGLTVAELAGVARAISFSHMSALAADHGQAGWKSVAFPISVDGLELVASLFLVWQRRAARHPGWLPWTALAVGTAASLMANVAVGGDDLIGRALAGWPAVSLLVSMKLLFSMFDHDDQDRPTVRDDQWTGPDGPDVAGTASGTDGDCDLQAGTVSAPAVGAVPPDAAAVADLIPAAKAARAALVAAGRTLSREALADRIREDGYAVSNARASLLLKILRAEDAAMSSDQRQRP